ncbi:MAG: methyltransferase [Tannerellaceae bacterium]|jgi:tRNA1Val (adenine37-N6)-methyltransferase|nr:methyltransferase [Tannerellaceae bacterium]
MANSYFQFKQFSVYQEGCAMKVGTDGVLLGAWTAVDGAARILDVGTGTGVIALMLAQRAPGAFVDAVEPDCDAARQAFLNFNASPFAHRIRLHRKTLDGFRQACAAGISTCPPACPETTCPATCSKGIRNFRPYNLIVSNPPYFSQSLKSPNAGRNIARHDDSLTLPSLLSDAVHLLAPGSRLSLILPADRFESFTTHCERLGFRLIRFMQVHPLPDKPPQRILFDLCYGYDMRSSRSSSEGPSCETLVLEDAPGIRSVAYSKLMKDFYLT